MLDERITWGCPIIGCPSYLELMVDRLRRYKLPAEPPYLPASFVKAVQRHDPGCQWRALKVIPPSLKGKNILVLSGGIDQLVPWSASEEFVSTLEKESGIVQVKVYEGVGHEYPQIMMDDLYDWAVKFL
jgi:hypothetical protein